jgi:hypothetical protein
VFITSLGQNEYLPEVDLTFSQLVAFPSVDPSIFDAKVGAKAIEVQIKLVFLVHLFNSY